MKFRFSLAIIGLATLSASLAYGQNKPAKAPAPAAPANAAPAAKSPSPNAPPAGQMPPTPSCMTPEDMQACGVAGAPGPMHQKLAESIGTWSGKNTMWMCPNDPPMKTDSSTTISSFMDGRFVKIEASGDMPGMGPFHGFGIYGYDNVAQKFQATWIDNCGTGMMTGTGELSSDGKTMTWTYNYTCPMTKKASVMREVHRITGKDTRTLEMYAPDKTGKEFKMMEILMTRKPGTGAAASATSSKTGNN